MSDFIKKCISGDAVLGDIDNYIDQWHEGDSDLPLHEYLGMTKREYALFIEDETYLAYIVTAHKQHDDIRNIIQNQIHMAARSANHAKSARIEKWLKEEKLW